MVKYKTVWMFLAIAAAKGLHVRHLDVKSAYLNADFDEELYMEQPPGFVVAGQETKVLRLKKSLYGLKQAARAWNRKAISMLAKLGFAQGNADQCLFFRKEKNGSITYLLIYMDDILVASDS